MTMFRLTRWIVIVLLTAISGASTSAAETMPVSGSGTGDLNKFDRDFSAMLAKWDIPGASISIIKDGRLVVSRGYGWANKEKKKPVSPTSVFRIGSLSKTVTAAAALKLCEDGALSLNQPAFATINVMPCNGCVSTDKYKKINVRHLLNCTAGWVEKSGDPCFLPYVAQTCHCSPSYRPTARSILSFWLCKDLDFEPGKTYSYSNVCYVALGELISKASKQQYPDYIRKTIVDPMGMRSLQPGSTSGILPNEVTYYASEPPGPSLFPNVKGAVPAPYGSYFSLEAITASAGLTATSIDMARFIDILCNPKDSRSPLTRASLGEMIKPNPAAPDPKSYFGMGVEVDHKPNRLEISRHGSLPGTMALMVHRSDGISWAAIFNSRPQAYIECRESLKAQITDAISKVKVWPTHNLFTKFDYPN